MATACVPVYSGLSDRSQSLAKVRSRAVNPAAWTVTEADPLVPRVPDPSGFGVPAALPYTSTVSRASPLAPIRVSPSRAAGTRTVARYTPGAITRVRPVPVAASTADCTSVWSPRPYGST